VKGHKRSFIKYSVIVMHWCFRIKIRERKREIFGSFSVLLLILVNNCH
jgi:hypothetical protein